jgi:hypothetical protein
MKSPTDVTFWDQVYKADGTAYHIVGDVFADTPQSTIFVKKVDTR